MIVNPIPAEIEIGILSERCSPPQPIFRLHPKDRSRLRPSLSLDSTNTLWSATPVAAFNLSESRLNSCDIGRPAIR